MWRLWPVLVFCVACSESPSETHFCPWYRQCGDDCGVCDDGDPCTVDLCIDSWTCGHRPLPCSVPIAEGLTQMHELALGDGGLSAPLRPGAITVTRDEGHVYVVSTGDQTVIHLVDHEGTLRWGEAHPLGLRTDLQLSHDQHRLYAAGAAGVDVLIRDQDTGRLEPGGAVLAPAQELAVSAAHLAARDSSQVQLYSEPETEPVQALPVSDGRGLVFSPDGHDLYVAIDGGPIVGFRVEGATQSLPAADTTLELPNALAVSADGARLYVVGLLKSEIAVFERVVESGALYLLGTFSSVDNPSDVVALGDNQIAVAAKSVDYDVFLYEWTSDQTLRSVGQIAFELPYHDVSSEPFARIPTDLPNPFYTEPGLFRESVHLAAPGVGLYISSRYSNSVLDAATLQLVQRGHGGVQSLAGAYTLALSPDDRHVYVAAREAGVVGSFSLNPETGELLELPQPTMPPGVGTGANGAVANVTVTPDGEHVLTVDASAGAVHVHRRSSESGHLTYHTSEEVPSCDGQPAFPVSVTVSPDGASVYVSDFQEPSAGKSCISHWRRTDDGALIEPEIYQENFLSGIESVVITADGRHVYTAAFSANAVGHYERLPETGKLVAKPAFETTDAFGAEFAALSPDEAHLYVTNPGFHRVLVFSRDEGSGTLSHVQTVNEGGDALVRGAAGIAAALDGDHVYVVSRLDDALNVFRVSDDGSLVSEVVVSGLEGMGWPNGLVMTSDQRYLIVASVRTSGLSLFQLPE